MILEKEGYFTAIPNSVIEALAKLTLPALETRVIWALFREVNGYQVKKRWVSWSRLEAMTGLHRRNIKKALVSLEGKGIIYARSNIYQFRPVHIWKGLSLRITPNKINSTEITPSISTDNLKLSPEITRKETLRESFKRKEKVVSQPIKKKREVPEGLKKLRVDIDHFKGRKK